MAQRGHEDQVVALAGRHERLAGLPQPAVIAEDPVELAVADLEDHHPDDRALLEDRMGDEDRGLAQAGIDLVIRDLGLEQHPGPLENLGQLGAP